MSYPIQTNPTPYRDVTCYKIANYLREGLNREYIPDLIRGLEEQAAFHLENNQIPEHTEIQHRLDQLKSGEYKPLCVVGVRDTDSFNIPNTEFPLLKVYRTADHYKSGNIVRMSPMVAAYCLVLPDQELLQPAMSWVSKTIRGLLLNSQIRFCSIVRDMGMHAEYRTLLTERAIPVYTFLRFHFNVTD